MKQNNVVVFGAGGHGKVIIDILEKMGCWHILGFLDSSKESGTEILDYKVLGNEQFVTTLAPETFYIVAVGDNWIRREIVKRLIELKSDLKFATAIHPTAVIARDVEIGPGTAVMAGAVINPCTRIGNHCKINTQCSVDHDNTIGDFAAIEPGAVLNGTIRVGTCSTVASGAVVRHGINIGDHVIVGAGATVLNDVEDRVIVYGTPAKVIRSRLENERYL